LILLDIISKDGRKEAYPPALLHDLANIQNPKSDDPKVIKIL
jgi:hypothetical protein